MKKYLHNRKLTEVTCDYCGNLCSKPTSEYLRSLKLGRKMFCSRSCSGANCNKYRDRKTGNYFIPKNIPKDDLSPFRYLLRSAKRRFKGCDLTLEQLKTLWNNQKGICPYTGFQLQLRSYKKNANQGMIQASLDRIDSNLPYTISNIEFVCVSINYLKAQFSKQEVIIFLNNFKNSDFSEDRTISSS